MPVFPYTFFSSHYSSNAKLLNYQCTDVIPVKYTCVWMKSDSKLFILYNLPCPCYSLLVSFPDIDECEARSHQCNPTQVCINTAGGYSCSCTEGYWLVAGQCQGEYLSLDSQLHQIIVEVFLFLQQFLRRMCALLKKKKKPQMDLALWISAQISVCLKSHSSSGEHLHHVGA